MAGKLENPNIHASPPPSTSFLKPSLPSSTSLKTEDLLYEAISQGMPAFIPFIISQGVDLSHLYEWSSIKKSTSFSSSSFSMPSTISKISPLGLAVYYGHLDIVNLLIDLGGIDVNEHDGLALFLALSVGNLDMIKLLLSRGAQSESNSKYDFVSLAHKTKNNSIIR